MAWTVEDQRASGRKWWRKNREYVLTKARERRRKKKLVLLWYKTSHPCVDCGEPDPRVLEFDHVRGKNFNISAKIDVQALSKTLAEIQKCEVVCSNCHRKRTLSRLQGGIHAEVQHLWD